MAAKFNPGRALHGLVLEKDTDSKSIQDSDSIQSREAPHGSRRLEIVEG